MVGIWESRVGGHQMVGRLCWWLVAQHGGQLGHLSPIKWWLGITLHDNNCDHFFVILDQAFYFFLTLVHSLVDKKFLTQEPQSLNMFFVPPTTNFEQKCASQKRVVDTRNWHKKHPIDISARFPAKACIAPSKCASTYEMCLQPWLSWLEY